MKILITHIYNSFNYGSAMMAINIIYYLEKNLKSNVKFYIDSQSGLDLERIKRACGKENIYRMNFKRLEFKKDKYKVIHILSKPFKAMQTFNNILNFCRYIKGRYDFMIVLGGDDLSEYYSKISLVFELIQIKNCSNILPIFLVGHTIGPFTSWRKKMASRSLKNCTIYTRDFLTYKYILKELKLEHVIESADLAFLDLPNQIKCNESILNNLQLISNDYITIVPSGLIESYCNNKKNYIKSWLTIVYELLNNKKLENKKIVFLPHVLGERGDQKVIKTILKNIDKKYFNRIISITEEPLSYVAVRYILGNGYFTITGRMHAAISTFQMMKPAISLSYSVKYSGVIGLGLDMNELIIESSNDEIWSSGEIVKKVLEKVDYVLENYGEIKNKIRKNTIVMKKKVIDQILDLSKRMEC